MEEQLNVHNQHLPTEDEDDDPPMLSSNTLAALKEFLAEQNQEHSNSTVETEGGGVAKSGEAVALVTEDWRLSQFWYDPETAETIAREVIALRSVPNSQVVCIACPTLYVYLKKVDPDISVKLLEYDKRFEQYGSDFTFYDYNQPEELPSELKHACQIIVADPPYLSKECLEKVTETIHYLAKPGDSHWLLLTGEVQKDRAAELMGLHPCVFRPRHSSKLGNEFRLFTNYDPGMRLGGWEQ
ncbi:N(6)-adenine-specific DNA methyltransferase 2 [Tripterygium wilfordii]|uniref:Protein-lysine N-methyltransferase HS088_TW05G00474 n=1 Tax=Tripterygium wilfordii TaxID=458696 RepID=A0A7J7DN57_TRIWF|nr:EEF1A lysine methyltransferase 1 [Tripterygium wilfordii]KAF5747747.1 N(6)-adenine-specific DNA methyltransferase 2 [Tripterygium wilfordii]